MKSLIIEQQKETNSSVLTFLYLQKCFDLIDKTKGNRLIDLACGNGSYSILADKNGFDVTALDARKNRIPFENKKIKWEIGNIEDILLKDFDVVIASGILYHLPLTEQIILLKKIKSSNAKYLIINTHFVLFNNEGISINNNFKHLLSDKQIINEWEGSVYKEGDLVNLKNRTMAAINNETSFWLTYNSSLKMIEYYTEMNITVLQPLLFEDRIFLFCEK